MSAIITGLVPKSDNIDLSVWTDYIRGRYTRCGSLEQCSLVFRPALFEFLNHCYLST